jgi:two-component system chemotaxis response regulator CheB
MNFKNPLIKNPLKIICKYFDNKRIIIRLRYKHHSNFIYLKVFKQKIEAIVIGGSAGSIKVVKQILKDLIFLPKLPVIIGLHRLQTDISSGLRDVIQYATEIPVIEPQNGEKIRNGVIYLAPVNVHLVINENREFELSSSPLVHYSRPSIDILFLSAADVYKENLLGVLLTGANRDGAYGMKAIKDNNGLTVVQEPKDCFIPTMTQAALNISTIDHVLYSNEIAKFLNNNFNEASNKKTYET